MYTHHRAEPAAVVREVGGGGGGGAGRGGRVCVVSEHGQLVLALVQLALVLDGVSQRLR